MIDVYLYGATEAIRKTQEFPKNLKGNIIKGMAKSLQLIVRDARINVRTKLNNTRAMGYTKFAGKTGRLMNSILAKPVIQEGNIITGIVGVVGKNGRILRYAGIHEFGGRITPKTQQALTIPLPPGTVETARILMNQGKTFLRNGIIFLKTEKKQQWKSGGLKSINAGYARPIFVLKKSVNIPARPYLRPAYVKNRPLIQKLIGASFIAAYSRGKIIK